MKFHFDTSIELEFHTYFSALSSICCIKYRVQLVRKLEIAFLVCYCSTRLRLELQFTLEMQFPTFPHMMHKLLLVLNIITEMHTLY